MNLLSLYSFGINLAQAHMDIRTSRHNLIHSRSTLRHTSLGWNEGNVMITSKEERDRVSIFECRLDSMGCRDEDVV